MEPYYIMTFEMRCMRKFKNNDIWLICELYNQYIQLIVSSNPFFKLGTQQGAERVH